LSKAATDRLVAAVEEAYNLGLSDAATHLSKPSWWERFWPFRKRAMARNMDANAILRRVQLTRELRR